jgi:hypothetical protein
MGIWIGTFTLFGGLYGWTQYKNDELYKKVALAFYENMNSGSFIDIYQTMDNRLQTQYPIEEFIDTLNQLTGYSNLSYQQTSISSSDNFSILIIDSELGKQVAKVSFGNELLANWKITNISFYP